MQILQFTPILKQARWGGVRLRTMLGKSLGDASNYAESWEISDHGDDQSVVSDGPYAGWTLHRLVVQKAGELLGRHAPAEQFPLLVKFLDAQDRLSVQVHPNNEQAKRFDPKENGKTEAWLIIHADAGSRLYAGLKPGTDRKTLRRETAGGNIESCLHSFAVAAGDCVSIPAGTVHAIGEGIVLAEIQQASDLTFRLHDWGRLDAHGTPRELHVEEALECIDFSRGPVSPVRSLIVSKGKALVEELVRNEYFVMRRHRGAVPLSIAADDRFHIVMLLEGNVEVTCGDERRRCVPGTTLLRPAVAPKIEIRPDGQATVLEAFLP